MAHRVHSVKIQGYTFPDFPNLLWHSGKFWVGEQRVKRVYNNGSNAMLIYGRKFGEKKWLPLLRRQAVRCEIELIGDPF